jgi:hypothetical protein
MKRLLLRAVNGEVMNRVLPPTSPDAQEDRAVPLLPSWMKNSSDRKFSMCDFAITLGATELA